MLTMEEILKMLDQVLREEILNENETQKKDEKTATQCGSRGPSSPGYKKTFPPSPLAILLNLPIDYEVTQPDTAPPVDLGLLIYFAEMYGQPKMVCNSFGLPYPQELSFKRDSLVALPQVVDIPCSKAPVAIAPAPLVTPPVEKDLIQKGLIPVKEAAQCLSYPYSHSDLLP